MKNDKILLVISILIAFVLWLYVYSGENREGTIRVPVNAIETRDNTMAYVSPTEVNVRVTGPRSLVYEAMSSPISIDINAGDQPLNRSTIRLSPRDIRVPGLEVLEITPNTIQLNVEETVIKRLRVQPLILHQPVKGYKISSITSNPEYVQVEGITSELSTLDSVQTRNISVSSLDTSDNFTVEFLDYYGIKSIEPDIVIVNVTVEEDIITQNFPGIPVACASGTSIPTEYELPEVVVSLEGRRDWIEEIIPGNITAQINCSLIGITGFGGIEVEVMPMENVDVVKITPDIIDIGLANEPAETVLPEVELGEDR